MSIDGGCTHTRSQTCEISATAGRRVEPERAAGEVRRQATSQRSKYCLLVLGADQHSPRLFNFREWRSSVRSVVWGGWIRLDLNFSVRTGCTVPQRGPGVLPGDFWSSRGRMCKEGEKRVDHSASLHTSIRLRNQSEDVCAEKKDMKRSRG